MWYARKMIALIMMQYVKLMLGIIIAAFAMCGLLSLHTGEPVMDIMFHSNTEGTVIFHGALENYVNKIPFVGYILDAVGISKNMHVNDGYEVLYEFVKMIMLFLSTHWIFQLLGKYIELWKNGDCVSNLFEKILRTIGNTFLLIPISLFNTIFTLLLYDWLHEFWIMTFGNEAISNWLLFATMVVLFGIIYFLVPALSRKSFVHQMAGILIDFGLVLCSVVFAYSASPFMDYSG